MSESDYILTIRARDKTTATELFDLIGGMEGVENVLITAPRKATRVKDVSFAKADRIINQPSQPTSFMEMLMTMAVENCASCDDNECPNHPSQVALRKARNSH